MKKVLSLVISLIMVLSSSAYVFAAENHDTDDVGIGIDEVLPSIISIITDNPDSVEAQSSQIEAFFSSNGYTLEASNATSQSSSRSASNDTATVVYDNDDVKIMYYEQQGAFQVTQVIPNDEVSLTRVSGSKYSNYITTAAYNNFGNELWNCRMRGYFQYDDSGKFIPGTYMQVVASNSGTTYSTNQGLLYLWDCVAWSPSSTTYVAGSNAATLYATFAWGILPAIQLDRTTLMWHIECTPSGSITYSY